jgi:hypothetical protein
MIKYKLIKNVISGEINSVSYKDGDKTCFIPFAPDNTDYQEYLEWLAEGNTPEEAD